MHKEYKKENPQNVKNIDKAHIDVVNALELQDRVFKTTDRTCFITMKDHKEGFQNSPTSRLLNPRKCEIGKISHQILSKLVTTVKNETNLNQFKNVYSCINWFKNLKEKPNLKFIVFDIVNFYPSITQELLEQALNWASQFTPISNEDKDIIFQARKSLLYFEGSHWTKKSSPNFNVPMGSYDGAEICDIVGLFLLSELKKLKLNADIGCYKDDGLGVSSSTPRQVESIKKKICETFRKFGLKITIEANKKIVQYLDVELNLEKGSFRPYIKPGNTPLYVHMKSIHPPQ